MSEKYTIRRESSTEYDLVRSDGTTAVTFTLSEDISNEELRVPADFAGELVTYWQQGEAAKQDVLNLVFAGVRYRDAR